MSKNEKTIKLQIHVGDLDEDTIAYIKEQLKIVVVRCNLYERAYMVTE